MDFAIGEVIADGFITDLILSDHKIFRHDANFYAVHFGLENGDRERVFS